MRFAAAVSVMLSILAALPARADTLTDNPKITPLDRSVQDAAAIFFSDSCHVGLSIGIYDHGEARFYNYGRTSKADGGLPTRDSLYEIGSVTKTFTGALAAHALIDGKMTLDADFRGYLKDAYPNLQLNDKPLTLRTLAAHTAGMPRDLPASDDLFRNADFEKLPYQLLDREKDYDRTRYLRELHDVHLSTEPGQTISYSNIGIKLIGFGLEDVYGEGYEALLGRFVFLPLHMTDTSLNIPADKRSRLVQGYSPGGNPSPHILPNSGAAGGLVSSSSDMIKYAAWQLDESDLVARTAHDIIAGDAATYGEALIWQVTTVNGEPKLWESGGVYGMSSQMILFPARQRAYVLLANDGCFNSQSQLETLALSVEASIS